MLEIGYVAAFLGGVLSLLSPCSALLLPAFFAYAFQSPLALARRTGVFFLGLAALLVPLGLGIGAISDLVVERRSTLILVAGVALIALGVLQLLGKGAGFAPLARLQQQVAGDRAGAVFLLGATYGFAGFCSGPILGAVLTVAAVSGSPLGGGSLLAVYALGMAVPLFALALVWGRLGGRSRQLVRGREVALGRLRLHTSALIAGVLFILVGVVFIATEGTAGLASLYGERATELSFQLNERIIAFTRAVPDLAVGMVAAFLAAALGWRVVRRRRRERASADAHR